MSKYSLEEELIYGNHNLSPNSLAEVPRLLDVPKMDFNLMVGELNEGIVNASDLFDEIKLILRNNTSTSKRELITQLVAAVESAEQQLNNSIGYSIEKIQGVQDTLLPTLIEVTAVESMEPQEDSSNSCSIKKIQGEQETHSRLSQEDLNALHDTTLYAVGLSYEMEQLINLYHSLSSSLKCEIEKWGVSDSCVRGEISSFIINHPHILPSINKEE